MPLMTQQGNGHIFIGTVTPTAILIGDIWMDTNTTPATFKIWNGSSWSGGFSGTSRITVAGVTDSIQNFILESM